MILYQKKEEALQQVNFQIINAPKTLPDDPKNTVEVKTYF